MERLTRLLEVKAVEDDGTFVGLASAYGNVDIGGDRIEPGAFSKTLKERGTRVPLLWMHNADEPIGIGELSDGSDGLNIKGTLNLDTQRGREVHSNLKKGIIKGLSIGYQTIRDEIKDGVRKLKELCLWEVSVVTFPMNPEATVTAVKSGVRSVRDFERHLHAAGWSRNEAKALASHGWPGLAQQPESDDESEQELLEWLQRH